MDGDDTVTITRQDSRRIPAGKALPLESRTPFGREPTIAGHAVPQQTPTISEAVNATPVASQEDARMTSGKTGPHGEGGSAAKKFKPQRTSFLAVLALSSRTTVDRATACSMHYQTACNSGERSAIIFTSERHASNICESTRRLIRLSGMAQVVLKDPNLR